MDEGATRPTTHILRPHHIGLLAVFILAFRDLESKLPKPFLLHVYRVLLNEISEIAEPRSRPELIHELSLGPKAELEEPQRLLSALLHLQTDLQTAEQLSDFFHSIPVLFVEKGEDEDTPDPPILARRSLFGYFCRRCFVTFIKLSSAGAFKLLRDFTKWWCHGDTQVGYEPAEKDLWNSGGLWLFKTSADRKTWAQTEPYAEWEKGQATGDENIAHENLRRFFEQRFHESNDSGYRQHALLNLVRMHYARNEYVAARKLLKEAITVARTSGDKTTLQHCISLLNRLPSIEPGRRPRLNEVQPDLNPLEILFDIKKLTHIPHQQPLSASFEKIIQALGVYDHWTETQRARHRGSDIGTGTDADQWAFHTVQAIVWAAIGCDELATVEENIVTAFTEAGGDDDNRLTVTLNRAYKHARQGRYTHALASLLEPDVWRGLTMNNYTIWAHQIWHILVLRASRRGQHRLVREFLEPRQPPGPYYLRDYWSGSPGGQEPLIRDPLYEVIELRECGQAATAVNQLLTALWHSEFLGQFPLYRTGIILLADVGLEFGMTKRSRRILEEIMPQVITGNDLEQRAFACFTLARCIIASASDDDMEKALPHALHYLRRSESDYGSLQIAQSLMDVQWLMAVVYQNMGMTKPSVEAFKRHFNTMETRKKTEQVVVDEEVVEVWKLVVDVGSALASR